MSRLSCEFNTTLRRCGKTSCTASSSNPRRTCSRSATPSPQIRLAFSLPRPHNGPTGVRGEVRASSLGLSLETISGHVTSLNVEMTEMKTCQVNLNLRLFAQMRRDMVSNSCDCEQSSSDTFQNLIIAFSMRASGLPGKPSGNAAGSFGGTFSG